MKNKIRFKYLKTKHSWHLVDPSPWPLVASLGAFFMTSGTVLYMNKFLGGGQLALIGLFVLLYVMYTWWRDIVREATFEEQHTVPVQRGLRLGMILFIVSEIMFFFAFFWAFFHSSLSPVYNLGGVWPPEAIQTIQTSGIPLTNTFFLLSSGATVTWAHHAIIVRAKKQAILGLCFTILLATIFTLLQGMEYMAHDPRFPRFMLYLYLFTYFMLILVTAGNFVQMFVGWKGVGFWFTRIQANKVRKKYFPFIAFILTFLLFINLIELIPYSFTKINLLVFILLLPLVGVFFLLLVPASNCSLLKNIALNTACITYVLSLFLWFFFNKSISSFQFVSFLVPFLNLNFTLGVDGISLFFILWTTLLIFLCILISWTSVKKNVKEFLIAFLVMEFFLIGVFSILDLLLFYIFFESVLIPMYLIVGVWRSRERKIKAAYFFFLCTLLGSVLMLFTLDQLSLYNCYIHLVEYICLILRLLYLWLILSPVVKYYYWLAIVGLLAQQQTSLCFTPLKQNLRVIPSSNIWNEKIFKKKLKLSTKKPKKHPLEKENFKKINNPVTGNKNTDPKEPRILMFLALLVSLILFLYNNDCPSLDTEVFKSKPVFSASMVAKCEDPLPLPLNASIGQQAPQAPQAPQQHQNMAPAAGDASSTVSSQLEWDSGSNYSMSLGSDSTGIPDWRELTTNSSVISSESSAAATLGSNSTGRHITPSLILSQCSIESSELATNSSGSTSTSNTIATSELQNPLYVYPHLYRVYPGYDFLGHDNPLHDVRMRLNNGGTVGANDNNFYQWLYGPGVNRIVLPPYQINEETTQYVRFNSLFNFLGEIWSGSDLAGTSLEENRLRIFEVLEEPGSSGNDAREHRLRLHRVLEEMRNQVPVIDPDRQGDNLPYAHIAQMHPEDSLSLGSYFWATYREEEEYTIVDTFYDPFTAFTAIRFSELTGNPNWEDGAQAISGPEAAIPRFIGRAPNLPDLEADAELGQQIPDVVNVVRDPDAIDGVRQPYRVITNMEVVTQRPERGGLPNRDSQSGSSNGV